MERRQNTSLYELLEVNSGASIEEIEASYQRLADAMAPDALAMYAMLDEDEADRMREQVDEAYLTLTDPERRAEYDRAYRERAGAEPATPAYPSVMVPAESSGASSMSVARGRRDLQETAKEAREVEAVQTERAPEPPAAPPPVYVAPPVVVAAAPVVTAPVPRPRPVSTRPLPQAPFKVGRLLKPSMDVDVTSDTEFSGSLLRRLRESAGANLEAVADITKISKRYLHALEENDFDTLPAAVYVRGFVSEYARALGLDPILVAKSYMTLYQRYRGEGS